MRAARQQLGRPLDLSLAPLNFAMALVTALIMSALFFTIWRATALAQRTLPAKCLHNLLYTVYAVMFSVVKVTILGPTSEPVSGCVRCPQGQYSLGGGQLFSQRTNAWRRPLSPELQTDCLTQNMFTGQLQPNCNPWEPSADGAYISSGDNSGVMRRFQGTRLYSTLRISATFVRNGSITYKFRVDAEVPYDGLTFQVDDDPSVGLISQSNGWKEVVVELPAGAHTLAWHYVKDYAGDAGEDRAYLKVVELVGTAWSDLHCHSCGGDMTNSGGSLCAFCDVNEYAAAKSNSELDFTCYPCPPNTYAPKGSIGISSCVEQRPCSMDDVDETFSSCKNGVREVSYSWSQPQTCDPTLKHSIKLPETDKGVECSMDCARGYRFGEDGECEPCGAGKFLNAAGKCKKCPAGTVAVNALEYGIGTPDAWNSWPQIINEKDAEHAGWTLTKSGLRFAHHSSEDQDAREWNQPSRSVLSFYVPFVHSGTFNLTYQLRGVPTFADDGSRAWIELEIRDAGANNKKKVMDIGGVPTSNTSTSSDDDRSEITEDTSVIHLLHGGENGTFNELVPINVTKTVVKEFILVVRATSLEAKHAIEAKVMYLGFTGTRNGAGVSCDTCPTGFEPTKPNDDEPGCRLCPAGTFSKRDDSSGVVACAKCPANTYSKQGGSTCTPCGTNTYSSAGAVTCAAPQALTLNASSSSGLEEPTSSSDAVSTALDGLQVTYNLSLLESLIWGNESWLLADTVYGNATSLQSTTPVETAMAFQADSENYWFAGLFRPLGTSWRQQVPGQIVDEEVDTSTELAYVVFASMTNPREAGRFFQQNTVIYGNVMCSAPPQWKLVNGGRHMEILPLESGAGVKVSLTDGSPCVGDKTMSTTFHFECDLTSGTTTKPASATLDDDDKCSWNIVWKTAYACPICDDDYFHELRSTCNGGEQLVSYARKLACYGDSESRSSETISTCSESAVVLDAKELYSVYAAVVIVGVVVLLLMMMILIVHRKYRTAYNDYMYLKGKMPTEEKALNDTSNETTFEFTPRSNALHSSSVGDDVASRSPSDRNGETYTVVDASDTDIDSNMYNVQSV
ncbi:hypothetical protein PsorP6_005203 [Peronosclerospora sorghi]|uniref:Uncharacterized protein n=1 Tax=Peronosclerospora sorghi TaxID=230839 RepID=A0ACC0W618_9STRA|nr:hypothetical protein PsorP6_005203 [Peronosclerospora sorghi]